MNENNYKLTNYTGRQMFTCFRNMDEISSFTKSGRLIMKMSQKCVTRIVFFLYYNLILICIQHI
jgi:hypothetical protein